MSATVADRFIDLMAAIKALDTGNNDEPMRHAVRKCKVSANMVLEDAINVAWAFVELAGHASKDCADALKDQHLASQPDTTESGK